VKVTGTSLARTTEALARKARVRMEALAYFMGSSLRISK
jgi:hypothetical protein